MSSLDEQDATGQLNATCRAGAADRARRNERRWLVPISVFRGLSVLCCLLWMPLVTHSDYLLFACVGIIAAQVGLIAIWSSLATTSASIRVPAAAGAALLLWVYFVVGYAWTEPGNRCSFHYWKDWWFATLCLPLFFVTIQAPLWLLRTLIGLRIQRAHESRPSAEQGDVTIRHIMLVTAVVAASLALTRLASPGDSHAVVAIVIGSLVAGAVSLITTLPAAVLLLSTRRLRNGVLGTVLHTAAILVIIKVGFLVAEIADGNRGRMRPPLWFLAGVAVLVISFSVCLTGVLLCVRGMGYRLQRARRSGQRTEAAVKRSSSE